MFIHKISVDSIESLWPQLEKYSEMIQKGVEVNHDNYHLLAILCMK